MAWTTPPAENVIVTVEEGDAGDVIVIRIDPRPRLRKSKKGFSDIIAQGTADVPGFPGMKVSLTAYTK
jgi:hypothetical protein